MDKDPEDNQSDLPNFQIIHLFSSKPKNNKSQVWTNCKFGPSYAMSVGGIVFNGVNFISLASFQPKFRQ